MPQAKSKGNKSATNMWHSNGREAVQLECAQMRLMRPMAHTTDLSYLEKAKARLFDSSCLEE